MFSYPSTPKAEVEDSYFGLTVPDPYRWLEDDCSPETSDWVKRQNSYTQSYLESIPYRNAIRKKMEQAWSYPRVGIPQQVGHFLFFFKNDGLQNQSILYRQDGVEGTPAVFFDPNLLSADGTTSLVGISFSYDDRYVAYSLSDAGSDWVTIRVAEVSSGRYFLMLFVGLNFRVRHGMAMVSFTAASRSLLLGRNFLAQIAFSVFFTIL